jgi:hypothetical protein
MHAIAIVVLCIASAVIYGILHDQITARVCVEYFTIGHADLFHTTSPTWLGIGWGIVATWWAGLLLGIPLAIAAREGHRPKKNVRALMRPIVRLLLIMALLAAAAWFIGFFLAKCGVVVIPEPLASRVPVDKHLVFLGDAWAHFASYLVGLIGGIAVIVSVWRSRGAQKGESIP